MLSDDTEQSSVSVMRRICTGAGMGIADAVPGVSGGTIALIAGIYEAFIAALHDCASGALHIGSAAGRSRLRRGIAFLLPLVIADVVCLLSALLLLARSDGGLLSDAQSAPWVYAFFAGLVAGSIIEPWSRRRSTRAIDYPLLALGAALAAAASGLAAGSLPLVWPVFLLGGALAIGVMLLPGISGSLVLLVLGLYQPIAEAVDSRDWPIIAMVATGVVLGAALVIPGLRALLDRTHDRTMAFLAGLMLGSLLALWPWKQSYDTHDPAGMHPILPQGWLWAALLAMALGWAVAWGLRRITHQREVVS